MYKQESVLYSEYSNTFSENASSILATQPRMLVTKWKFSWAYEKIVDFGAKSRQVFNYKR